MNKIKNIESRATVVVMEGKGNLAKRNYFVRPLADHDLATLNLSNRDQLPIR
jgi:hypothetical protein